MRKFITTLAAMVILAVALVTVQACKVNGSEPADSAGDGSAAVTEQGVEGPVTTSSGLIYEIIFVSSVK